jgi:hypothetical protein
MNSDVALAILLPFDRAQFLFQCHEIFAVELCGLACKQIGYACQYTTIAAIEIKLFGVGLVIASAIPHNPC